jgi:hypothetical protein
MSAVAPTKKRRESPVFICAAVGAACTVEVLNQRPVPLSVHTKAWFQNLSVIGNGHDGWFTWY